MSLTKVSYSMINGIAVNVLDYGADPTGTNDSTLAFQAAAVAANNGVVSGAGPGGTVYIPKGTYLVSRVGLRDTILIGENRDSTIIRCNTNAGSAIYFLDAATDRDGTTANTVGGGGFQNLTIDGNSKTNVSGARTYGGGVVLSNLKVTGCQTGVALGLPIWATVQNVYSYTNDIGFFTYAGVGDTATSTTFLDCWADSCTTYGFHITQLAYSSFINSVAQDCGVNNWYVEGNANSVTAVFSLQFIGCATEGTGVPFYFKKIRDLTVLGPRVISPDSGVDLITCDDTSGTITDFSTPSALSGGAYHLKVLNNTAGVGAIKLLGGYVTYNPADGVATGAVAPVGPSYGQFQNSQSGNYTLVLSDAGKMLYYPTGAGATFSIPANASVAFPIGTEILFVNRSGNNLLIACADTMILASTFTTGTRTLAAQSMATAKKVEAGIWIIGSIGGGLT